MNMSRVYLVSLAFFHLHIYCNNHQHQEAIRAYASVAIAAVENSEAFCNFKRHKDYIPILEHVSEKLGYDYLNHIVNNYPDFFNNLNKFKTNDLIGNPYVYNYEGVGFISPTTLRYIKVAADLQFLFGDLSKMHLVEIGGGYGGQCKILHDLGQFASYTIIDIPEAVKLAKKYLDMFDIKNVEYLSCDDYIRDKNYDLVISNYAVSEIGRDYQKAYFDTIISRIAKGYLTCNYMKNAASNLFNIFECFELFNKKGISIRIEDEKPLTGLDNKLVYWGTLKNN